jgi:mevalonate kinase
MKYVVCQVKVDDVAVFNFPVAFPNVLVHSLMFEGIQTSLQKHFQHMGKRVEIVALSAGEFSSVAHKMGTCHGESESLGVSSRELEDDDLFKMSDYGSGVA